MMWKGKPRTKGREKYENAYDPWFAWHPVKLTEGPGEGDWVWLENVWKKYTIIQKFDGLEVRYERLVSYKI